ncbi:hypothetical protein BCR43DRAFT_491906 [Syncephalastrum racemosum]|uniref:Uncharacterized protein n=1 Tax=Syncephalastrum racemosum TaxID=13706 RepID=A0A1X2HCP1_SYNRA|nr:hypothetical protein BCR43DRAFT_491906 [Syncephalastrum racemosum]
MFFLSFCDLPMYKFLSSSSHLLLVLFSILLTLASAQSTEDDVLSGARATASAPGEEDAILESWKHRPLPTGTDGLEIPTIGRYYFTPILLTNATLFYIGCAISLFFWLTGYALDAWEESLDSKNECEADDEEIGLVSHPDGDDPGQHLDVNNKTPLSFTYGACLLRVPPRI